VSVVWIVYVASFLGLAMGSEIRGWERMRDEGEEEELGLEKRM